MQNDPTLGKSTDNLIPRGLPNPHSLTNTDVSGQFWVPCDSSASAGTEFESLIPGGPTLLPPPPSPHVGMSEPH